VEASEAEVHSFILKVWRVEEGEDADRPLWRGHITHVPGGERRYVQDLEEITSFVASYLEQMGAQRDASRP
jgi:hypothetical protein